MTEQTLKGHATFDGTFEEPPSTIRSIALPDVIDGRYRVLGRIGSGAMGIVFRAEDLFLQRPVAVKIVERGPSAVVTDRFMKEAQSLARVRHENVVQVYAFGRFQSASYLAMELVAGESLEAIIDRHAANGDVMDRSRAMAILRAVGQGLEAVHAQRLVHRDVKPANIIIEHGTDRPVLIDFGLARRRSASNPRLSTTGGTPSYMAPEQATDPHGLLVGPRTDLYAFACTAFELFTGHPVFEGNDVFSVLLQHMNDAPRRMSAVRPELEPLDDVMLRALSKTPDERLASASELVAAFEARLPLVGAVANGPRVLVVATETGFRRSLVRNTTAALKAKGCFVRLDQAASAVEAVARIGGGEYDLLVIDEESAGGRTTEMVALAQAKRPDGEIVIVSRDLSGTVAALGEHRVRHLVPKPLNVHVLAAVLGRTSLAK